MEDYNPIKIDFYPIVKPVDFRQKDNRWREIAYAVDGEKSTIQTAGSGPVVLADVLASLVSQFIDPLTCASWARMNGYKLYHAGTSYQYPHDQAQAYGVKVTRLNEISVYGRAGADVHREALEQLLQGNWLIACMGKGLWTNSGHYVLAYGYEGGNVYINDPDSQQKKRICNRWTVFKKQVKYYWAVKVPENAKRGEMAVEGEYRQEDFVRECQMCLGAGIDGEAGRQTLCRTITISCHKNRNHNVVFPLQKLLHKKGYYRGKLDGIAGKDFIAAVNAYQIEVLNYARTTDRILEKGSMWKSLFEMSNEWLW